MKFLDRLSKHDAIGVDFDGTLIGNPASPILWAFIYANPQKRFHIITFRLKTRAAECFPILEAMHQDRPLVPVEGQFSGLSHLNADRDDPLRWKAQECQRLGLTAMIDDEAGNVEAACTERGIEFFDACNLLEYLEGI